MTTDKDRELFLFWWNCEFMETPESTAGAKSLLAWRESKRQTEQKLNSVFETLDRLVNDGWHLRRQNTEPDVFEWWLSKEYGKRYTGKTFRELCENILKAGL